MYRLQTQLNDIILIEIPTDTTDLHYDSHFTRYINHSNGVIKLDINTRIICVLSKMIDEDIKNYLEWKQCGQSYYYIDYNSLKPEHIRPKNSFISLMIKNDIDVTKEYLVLSVN